MASPAAEPTGAGDTEPASPLEPAPMRPMLTPNRVVLLFTVIYGGMALVAFVIRGFVFDHWLPTADLGLPPLLPVLVAVGGTIAILLATPLINRMQWARDIAVLLRRSMGEPAAWQALALGVTSGFGEEILFRGALQPWLGPVVATIIFGLLHAMRGWWLFALIVGAGLAALYEWSGTIWPGVIAHVGINTINIYRTPRWAREWDDELQELPELPAAPESAVDARGSGSADGF